MNFVFRQKRISGLLAILPANERSFVDEIKNFNFSEARSLKLREVMGYNKHRLVKADVCVSDLAAFGMKYLFKNGLLKPDEFDALLLITQSPDYFLPPTSNVIQGQLGLKHDLLCMDINQGCAGFVVGLIQAFLLLEQQCVKKVVLINADVLSRKTSPRDRSSYPLIGDAASITIVEADTQGSLIHANLKMDGSRAEALMIPAGGFRMPSTAGTAVLEEVGENNLRAKDHLRMDGSAVFNFVQVDVPPLIDDLLARAGAPIDSIDYFLFHQPNRFMLQKLAEKLKVPYAKMPSNVVENFGNSSGVTIPIAAVFNLGRRLLKEQFRVCLGGFGTGLAWASMLLSLGELGFCRMIDYP